MKLIFHSALWTSLDLFQVSFCELMDFRASQSTLGPPMNDACRKAFRASCLLKHWIRSVKGDRPYTAILFACSLFDRNSNLRAVIAL